MREVFREVASLVIYNPTLDKILVQDRTSISKYGEEVTFFGGWLDEGESPLQAAERESIEELKIDFGVYNYLWQFIHDKEGKDYVRNLFFVLTDQEIFEDEEWDWAIWLSIQEAKIKKFTTDVKEEFVALEEHIRELKKR